MDKNKITKEQIANPDLKRWTSDKKTQVKTLTFHANILPPSLRSAMDNCLCNKEPRKLDMSNYFKVTKPQKGTKAGV